MTGTDFDIVFRISTDDGRTWTLPRPLHANAFFDHYDDVKPSLVSNSEGVFVVTWIATENVAGLKGNDPVGDSIFWL